MINALLVALGMMSSQCDYVAITYSGDLYVLGSGTTCLEAMENHGPIPNDWREIKLVEYNVVKGILTP